MRTFYAIVKREGEKEKDSECIVQKSGDSCADFCHLATGYATKSRASSSGDSGDASLVTGTCEHYSLTRSTSYYFSRNNVVPMNLNLPGI